MKIGVVMMTLGLAILVIFGILYWKDFDRGQSINELSGLAEVIFLVSQLGFATFIFGASLFLRQWSKEYDTMVFTEQSAEKK